MNTLFKIIIPFLRSIKREIVKFYRKYKKGGGFYFYLIDESCFPKPTDASDYSVLLAVCIRKHDIRELAQRDFANKTSVFGGEPRVEIKAKKLIIPKTLKPNRTKNKEFVIE